MPEEEHRVRRRQAGPLREMLWCPTDEGRRDTVIGKLLTGGQTGVDRGTLDAALNRGFPCGGWCPSGRRAEDGPIPDHYPLNEMSTTDYLSRTHKNVTESDATLVLTPGSLQGGTRAAVRHCHALGKPCMIAALGKGAVLKEIESWLRNNAVKTLNVAGPRESEAPGIQHATELLINLLLDRLGHPGHTGPDRP